MGARVACGPQHRAKAPRVVVAQHDSVAEFKIDMVVPAQGGRSAIHAHAARHSKMDDQRILPQAEEQVFASPFDGIDNPPHEAVGKVGGNRPSQATVVESDGGHLLPLDVRRDTAQCGFNLGKLGHTMLRTFVARPNIT